MPLPSKLIVPVKSMLVRAAHACTSVEAVQHAEALSSFAEESRKNTAAGRLFGMKEGEVTPAMRVATACPFCYIMLDDGVKAAGVEETEVKVADIAIHLLDAIEAGERSVTTQGNARQNV